MPDALPDSLIVFDLDGTLVDTIDDLAASANRLLAAHGHAPVDASTVRPMVGDGVAALVRRVLAHAGLAIDAAAATAAFAADYEGHAAEASRPFPGVVETLHRLRQGGWRLAVCTNKPAAAAARLLTALELAPLLAAIGGGDSFATRKPDPGHLLDTIRAAGGVPQRALLVGDHANDVLAARAASVPCIFARWGYGSPSMSAGCAAIADRVGQVPALASALLATATPASRSVPREAPRP